MVSCGFPGGMKLRLDIKGFVVVACAPHPQVLCPRCLGSAVRARSHLGLWSAAHSPRDHPHCLFVHPHQRLPGHVHLHLPLRAVQKGKILTPIISADAVFQYKLDLFIQQSLCLQIKRSDQLNIPLCSRALI